MPDDFADLVREHQGLVFRTLRRMLGTDDVDDHAQEVFLRLHRALPQFGQRSRLSTYLYRIVLNVARDAWARRRRPDHATAPSTEDAATIEDRLPDRGPSVQAILEQRELLAAVDTALTDLAPAERAAIVLFHQEERSYDEIAAVLDVPVGTVRTHLHRGRAKVAALVRERMRLDVL